ncbi:MAG: methylmalonyl Co-A mutase-associated GTPase MeaB [Elusimicrobia bacterium]|nr:methylmalonyl Co-A mutase-associated GTPase MeaB [Elusimicrobiota bacterium]
MNSLIVRRILRGDVGAAARLMRDLDDELPSARSALKELYARAGRAHVVGITGSPGAGKSTLADKLVEAARKGGKSVGVVAVDPTSPFSGGAVLGDRIRMQRHTADPGVFIRSLAARGSLGGLSRSVFDTVTVLDAMGKDLIILETAGVGQDGVKVAGAAHTVLVVLSPGQGDDIQALKAGILEIGDIYVVNKCDRKDSEQLTRSLGLALEGTSPRDGWTPPIIKTAAVLGRGTRELVDVINEHRSTLVRAGAWERRSLNMARTAFMELLETGLRGFINEECERGKDCRKIFGDLAARKTDPYSAAKTTLRKLLSKSPPPPSFKKRGCPPFSKACPPVPRRRGRRGI